jgi:BirA family biotin operon repressor/biotin-[acetyl-CoA-carboxylase] ligase
MNTPLRWLGEAIWEAVAPDLPGFTVEILPEIDSTNTELMRRARAGRFDPVLLVAEHQTAGRGRLGRDWHSGASGSNARQACPSLTFSIGIPLAPRDWSGLSLAVGLSLVESLHPDLRLKWPNDVYFQGRKLAGILIETVGIADTPGARYAVVGVGINLHARSGDGLTTAPAWLQEMLPDMEAPEVLQQVVTPLIQTLKAFEHSGFSPFQARFNTRDALVGMDVALSDGSSGRAQGVDVVGALQVLSAQGLHKVTSSEVSVRPAQQPTANKP